MRQPLGEHTVYPYAPLPSETARPHSVRRRLSLSEAALSLLRAMICIQPTQRSSARALLSSPWIENDGSHNEESRSDGARQRVGEPTLMAPALSTAGTADSCPPLSESGAPVGWTAEELEALTRPMQNADVVDDYCVLFKSLEPFDEIMFRSVPGSLGHDVPRRPVRQYAREG